MKKIKLIKLPLNTVITSEFKKIPNFTTNIDYIGHLNDIPYYYDSNIKTQKIVFEDENNFKLLDEGNYKGTIRQSYKKGNKEIIEIIIDNQVEPIYVNFTSVPTNESVIESIIKQICENFKVNFLTDLKGKKVNVKVKHITGKDGKTYPQYQLFNPENVKTYDYDCEIPSSLKKVGSNYIVVDILTTKPYTEIIFYNLNNEFGLKNFNKVKSLSIGTKGKFKVKHTVGKDGKTYQNKSFVVPSTKKWTKKSFYNNYGAPNL